MILLGNILIGIGQILHGLISIYTIIIIIGALISWVNPDPMNSIVRFIREATEPLLRPIRRHLPVVIGGRLDLSPLVLLLGLQFIDVALVQSLMEYALRLKLAA
jgi:YggT family protein